MPQSHPTSLAPSDLHPDPDQPRRTIPTADQSALIDSVRMCGILQPVRIRRAANQWVIIDGERRWRAAKELGLVEIPVIVEERAINACDVMLQQLGANLARSDLSPIEKGEAIRRAIMLSGRSAGDVAAAVGVSAAHASKLLAILELPEAERQRVQAGSLGLVAAYRLARPRRAREVVPARQPRSKSAPASTSRKPVRVKLGKGLALVTRADLGAHEVIDALLAWVDCARARLDAGASATDISLLTAP